MKSYEIIESLKNVYDVNHDPYLMDDLEEVIREIKALEIIKKKKVNVLWLLESTSCYSFNLAIYKDHKLSRKEYRFLKEVLK